MDCLIEVNLRQPEIQLSVFIFSEIKYLVYKSLKNPDILIGNLYESPLLRSKVVCLRKLGYGFGDKSQGVRKSCDTLVKNISFDWVAACNCSFN